MLTFFSRPPLKCSNFNLKWLKTKRRFFFVCFLKLPLLARLSPRCPAATIFGNNTDVGVISFVFCFQAGQVSWGGHAPADSNFPQTLESMSGSHFKNKRCRRRFSKKTAFRQRLSFLCRKRCEFNIEVYLLFFGFPKIYPCRY